jgi:release factor glutamine methyltransferase
MAADHRLTVQGALDRATTALIAAGLVEPRREAVRLLADLLGLSPAELLIGRANVVEPDRRRWIDRAVERRVRGEPLQYVTGLAGFRALELRVDRRVLIPRPETEGLVDLALRYRTDGVVADIGTGSGCIALALRQEGRYRTVVAADRSAEALAVASMNGHRLRLGVEFVQADLTTSLRNGSIDMIVSNPPYVSAGEYDGLEPAVRAFEPRLALESGTDGLQATRDLLLDGWRVLRPGGWIVVEIAGVRGSETAAVAMEAGYRRVQVAEDVFGRPRYLTAFKGE